VTAEDDVRVKLPQLPSRRSQPQYGMDCQPLVPGTEIRGGAEHVGADEHAAVGPPERDLLPGTAVLDGDAGERTERALREEVVADAEPSGESGAGAVVPVEQLNHARRRARRLDAFLHVVPVDGVDHPDAAVHDEGVRAALHELVNDPAEAAVELVAEADSHPGESTGTR
jgi:hypothetical protein